MAPRSLVRPLNMTVDEAMKMIVTLGVVTPGVVHDSAAPKAVAPPAPGP